MPGRPIIQWPSTGGREQEWTLRPAADGHVLVINANSGLALDCFGNSPAPGTPIVQWHVNRQPNQQGHSSGSEATAHSPRRCCCGTRQRRVAARGDAPVGRSGPGRRGARSSTAGSTSWRRGSTTSQSRCARSQPWPPRGRRSRERELRPAGRRAESGSVPLVVGRRTRGRVGGAAPRRGGATHGRAAGGGRNGHSPTAGPAERRLPGELGLTEEVPKDAR